MWHNRLPTFPGTLTCLLCLLLGILGMAEMARTDAGELPGPCEPGLVEYQPFKLSLTPVAYRPVGTGPAVVTLEWIGHSSFLLTSPGGVHLLTDPNELHPPSMLPDAVTVSNLHITHRGISGVPGTPQIFWGILPEQGWNQIRVTFGDVSLFNVPSYASRTRLEQSPVQNSIFVFRTGGLCLVHLGNLRHPLTTKQLQQIGRPDVLMVPVDGQWTLDFADVLTVIEQLKPRLVIPMHIDIPGQAEGFVRYTANRYPLRRIRGRTLTLSRALLPSKTALVLFSD